MSTNPFSGPYSPPPEIYDPALLPARKPGALTAVAVAALTLGILGLFASCSSLAILPFQSQMQGALNPVPGPGAPPIAKLQNEMQTAMNAAMDKYFVGQILASIAHLVVTTCLIVGAVMVLRMNPRGRAFLMYTLLAVIVFEVLRTIFVVMIQLEIMPITNTFMERMMRESAPAGNPGGPAIASVMKGAMYFGLVLGLAWPLIKIIVYAVSARYLASKPIVALFDQGTAAKPV